LRGGVLLLAARAAAQPEAWPIAIAGAIERADGLISCLKSPLLSYFGLFSKIF